MGERKRETVKERERKKTDVPKLYAYNENERSVRWSTTLLQLVSWQKPLPR